MQAFSHELQQRPGRRDLMPLDRAVVASRTVEAPFSDVERAVRVCLAQLVEAAFPSTEQSRYDLVADVSMRHWSRHTRVPVAFEVESARHGRSGQIAHLRWRARRHPKLFPVMEADLVLRPSSGKGSELVLEGAYRAPFRLLGLLGDLLIGRLVARSTAEAFIDGLSGALEAAIIEGRCTRCTAVGHAPFVSEVA